MFVCFFFQAEDGIRDLVRSRGLGDVYKRQCQKSVTFRVWPGVRSVSGMETARRRRVWSKVASTALAAATAAGLGADGAA